MAIIKCKMCGGDLDIVPGSAVAECEYCGSRQTVPAVDDEKKLTLFARANRLRAACDFDKAAGIFETIVADFPEEAEAYWGLVLCKYGIEYVDDPATGKKIPTCHRSGFDSVMDDSNFEQAMENADELAKKVYREEAKQFERIRKGILAVSSNEKPYDIFICYKETAADGDRTLDSVLAQDLYSALTDKGYRVFFSRITLQGKLGEAYEPYIFAALNSAKVMLAVGTCYEHYNAVWVKNEWSRYLKICEADKSKHLIPCYKDLDPEDMPKEFNHLQGADLGKMGAIQDILFNMEKYIPKKEIKTVIVPKAENVNTAPLLRRVSMFLEEGKWKEADTYCERVLDMDPECAEAYIGKLMAERNVRTQAQLSKCASSLLDSEFYKKAIRFANEEEKNLLEDAQRRIVHRLDEERREKAYRNAIAQMRSATDEKAFKQAASEFGKNATYKDSQDLKKQCLDKAEDCRKSDIYAGACSKLGAAKDEKKAIGERIRFAEEASSMFSAITGFMNSNSLGETSNKLAEELKAQLLADQKRMEAEESARKDAVLSDAKKKMEVKTLLNYQGAQHLLGTIPGWKDADILKENCRQVVAELKYQDMLQKAKMDLDASAFQTLANEFEQFGDYQDSKNLAQHCRKRAEDIIATQKLAEEQRLAQEEQARKQKEPFVAQRVAYNNKLLKIWLIIEAALCIASVIAVVLSISETTNTGELIGHIVAGVVVEAIACGGVILTSLFALLAANKQGKISKVLTVLSRIFAIIGILLWGVIAVVYLFGATEKDPFGVWAVLTFAVHAISLVLLFFKKKI